jgi:hypothetical protein
MIDMLARVEAYVRSDEKSALKAKLETVADLTSDDVRRNFDLFMASDPDNGRYAVASCFLTMLTTDALMRHKAKS